MNRVFWVPKKHGFSFGHNFANTWALKASDSKMKALGAYVPFLMSKPSEKNLEIYFILRYILRKYIKNRLIIFVV